MNIFEAMRACDAGHHVRHEDWLENVATPVPGTTGKRVTAWLARVRGICFYRPTGGEPRVDRVVENPDVTFAQFRSNGWTLQDANGNTPPLPAISTPSDSLPESELASLPADLPPGSSGAGGNAGNGGGGGGDGGGSGGGSGGGGTGGSSGGTRDPGRRTRPERTAPALVLTCVRTTETPPKCVALVGGIHNDAPRVDNFTWDASLAADLDARAGEVWFLNVGHGSPAGYKTVFNGTIAPGANQSGNFNITAKPGAGPFRVQANVHLAGVGLSNQASTTVKMLGHCDQVPVIENFKQGTEEGDAFSRPSSGDGYVVEVLTNLSVLGLQIAWYAGPTASGAPISTGNIMTFGGLGPFSGTTTCKVWNEFDFDVRTFTFTIAAP